MADNVHDTEDSLSTEQTAQIHQVPRPVPHPVPLDEEDTKPRTKALPKITVVDKRHWAAPEAGEGADAGPHKPTYVEDLETKLQAAQKQVEEIRIQYAQALQEFENGKARLRRDNAKELEGHKKSVLSELLEVVDNLDRALDFAAKDAPKEVLRDGVALVRTQFLARLEGFGVKRMGALGTVFDPTKHEAASIVPTDSEASDNQILGVIREGYLMGSEVLRPAVVAVARVARSEIV